MVHQLKVIEFNTFFKRLRGLMGKRTLPSETWFLLTPCNSIHTFGMKVSIDCLFISKEGIVIGLHERIAPRRIQTEKKAFATLEAAIGTLQNQKIKIGDRVTW
jgi:uncharacterized membrane protein (UPF0127 family)